MESAQIGLIDFGMYLLSHVTLDNFNHIVGKTIRPINNDLHEVFCPMIIFFWKIILFSIMNYAQRIMCESNKIHSFWLLLWI